MQIWAHRGASRDAPENTLPAVELALQQGADGVEIDVQLSRDGRVVVLHDETVDRTTDGTGAVADLDFEALRALDASGGDERFAGTRIPTLAEVLEATAAVRLNIELKNDEVPYPGLEEKVLAEVATHDAADRVVLSSFNGESVRRLATLGAASQRGLLYSGPLLRPIHEARRRGARAVHAPVRWVTPGLVRRAHRHHCDVRVWTVNAPDDMRRMGRWGVDAIITDVPEHARSILHERSNSDGAE